MKRTVGAPRLLVGLLLLPLLLYPATAARSGEATGDVAAPFAALLEAIPPLTSPLGQRPPLFLWSPEMPVTASDAQLETTLQALQARGLCLFLRWQPEASNTMTQLQRVAGIQKRLGLPVAVDATPVSHGLFPKGDAYSHVGQDGKPFRGSGLSWNPGCPCRATSRNDAVRGRIESYARAQQAAQLPLDYWISDWELDGPNEWKQSWAVARKCVTCCRRIPDIATNFPAFQAVVRQLRAEMQRENFVQPVQACFPAVRIGNYAMNPHDGYRYYWDYYEEDAFGKPNLAEGIAYRREQGAYYRPWWRGEFETSGYNLAAPVIYAWYHLFANYAFTNTDYRWFYGMLLEGTSVTRHTPANTPLIPFLHGLPIGAPDKPSDRPAGFAPLSAAMFKELAWHLLLRGADSFILWAPGDEVRELQPLQAAYAESLAYPEFFEKGTPVLFDLPNQPGVVVSALKLDGKLLVRRTDFGNPAGPFTITLDRQKLAVPLAPGRCQVLTLE
jgi:hypothetical protein